MTLSQREKYLLLFLGILIIFVGGFALLILPIQGENKALSAEVSVLEEEMMLMQMTINQNSEYLNQLKESEDQIQTSLNQISNPIDAPWYDDNLTSYASKAGIEIEQISYNESSPSFPGVNYNNEGKSRYELLIEIENLNDLVEKSEVTRTADYEILRTPVSISFKGSQEKTVYFIRQLYADQETIYVNSLDYDYENKEGTVQVDIYSIDKIDKSDILSSKQDIKKKSK